MTMTGLPSVDSRSALPWLAAYPSGLDWHHAPAPTTLPALLDKAVSTFGDRPCLTFAGRTTSYRDLGAQVAKARSALSAAGVKRGDRVGLFLPNCPPFIEYFYAALACGAVVVNFNPSQSTDDLVEQIRDSGTTVMVTLDLKALFERVEALLAQGVLQRAVVTSFAALLPPAKAVAHKLFKSRDLAQPSRSAVADRIIVDDAPRAVATTEAPLVSALSPVDDAVIQYTGGATGIPKGAVLSHANITVNAAQLAAWSTGHIAPGKEKVLAVLPFFHVFALTGIVVFAVALGAEIIIQPRFQIDETLDILARQRPTIVPGVPTLFAALANHKRTPSLDLSSLKLCISGGAALPVDVAKAFHKATGATLIEAYGLSETSPAVTCNPLDGRARPGSIGLPLQGTRVDIIDPERPEQPVPIGQPGEICVSGPQVCRGYWQADEATKQAFLGDTLRTGDIGYMDRDGFLFVVDRIKDVIITSGFKVYPRRIEDKLYQHPAVEEATVIGIPDSRRGAVPKAFVKLKAGATVTEAEVLEFLSSRLSKVELPVAVDIRASLPKTVIGKLSKKELLAEEMAKILVADGGSTDSA